MAIAWHWTANTLRDGRPIPPIGEWLVHDGPIAMCKAGLHASLGLRDALLSAPGWHLHRVECLGVEDRDHRQIVCRRRRILASADMSLVLPDYIRQCGGHADTFEHYARLSDQASDSDTCNLNQRHAMDEAYVSSRDESLLLLYWNMLTGRKDLC